MFRYTQKTRFERVFMGSQYHSIHPLIAYYHSILIS